MNNAKETAAIIRNEIKAAGIKALVRMPPGSKGRSVQVNNIAYNVHFTEDEQRKIKEIAISHGLTFVRGLEIDLDQMTNPNGFEFYLGY